MIEPLECATAAEWRRWLEAHHDTETGVWLLIAKKGATRPGVSLVDATEEALCFGWIDSAMRPVDEERERVLEEFGTKEPLDFEADLRPPPEEE